MKQKITLILCLLIFGASISAYGQSFRMQFCRDAQAYGVQHRRSGEWTIEPRYDRFRRADNRHSIFRFVRCKNDKWGIVDLRTGREVVFCQFDAIIGNISRNDVASAQLNGKWGYIHTSGTTIVPFIYPTRRMARNSSSFTTDRRVIAERMEREIMRERAAREERLIREAERAENERIANSFSTFAHKFVETNINQWQQRGEFESFADWQARVNDNTRQTKVRELFQEAEQMFIQERSQGFSIGNIIGGYNIEYEHFPLLTDIHGNLFLPVPISEAQSFRNKWESHLRMPRFAISNDRLALVGMTFIATDGTASSYNFSVPVEIIISESDIAVLQSRRNVSTANLTARALPNEQQIPPNVAQHQPVQQNVQTAQVAENIRQDRQSIFSMGISPVMGMGGMLANFGICGKLRFNLTNAFRIETAFVYYLPRDIPLFFIDTRWNVWEAGINMHIATSRSDIFSLYSLVGLNIMGLEITTTTNLFGYSASISSHSETIFGFNLGGGFDLRLSNRVFLNVESRYLILTVNNEGWGGRFMISAGLVYRF